MLKERLLSSVNKLETALRTDSKFKQEISPLLQKLQKDISQLPEISIDIEEVDCKDIKLKLQSINSDIITAVNIIKPLSFTDSDIQNEVVHNIEQLQAICQEGFDQLEKITHPVEIQIINQSIGLLPINIDIEQIESNLHKLMKENKNTQQYCLQAFEQAKIVCVKINQLIKQGSQIEPILECINRILHFITAKLGFIEDEETNYLAKIYAKNLLKTIIKSFLSLRYQLQSPVHPADDTDDLQQQQRLEQEQILQLSQNIFNGEQTSAGLQLKNCLQAVRKIADSHYLVPNQVFIAYAWAQDSSQQEKWVELTFLPILRQHLRDAGIRAKLDRIDNRGGSNIYYYMNQVTDSDKVILVGTSALLTKHIQGTAAVCSELILINRKRRNQTGAILPILLAGSFINSFPPYLELYSTIRDWHGKSYVANLKGLIQDIYDIGPDDKRYHPLWDDLLIEANKCVQNNHSAALNQQLFINEFLEDKFFRFLESIGSKINNFYPSNKPKVFISYARGSYYKYKVEKIAQCIAIAGIDLRFDINSNQFANFTHEIDTVDYVLIIGTIELVEECNQQNLALAEAIEYGGQEINQDEEVPVVSREMIRILKRLEQIGKLEKNKLANCPIIPISLMDEISEVFPKELLNIGGYSWQRGHNYNEIFQLLQRLLPKLSYIIAEQNKNFRESQNNINAYPLTVLQKAANEFYQRKQQEQENQMTSEIAEFIGLTASVETLASTPIDSIITEQSNLSQKIDAPQSYDDKHTLLGIKKTALFKKQKNHSQLTSNKPIALIPKRRNASPFFTQITNNSINESENSIASSPIQKISPNPIPIASESYYSPETFEQASKELLTTLCNWRTCANLEIDNKVLIIAIDVERPPVEQAQSWLQQLSQLIFQYWKGSLAHNGIEIDSDNLLHTLRITLKTALHAKTLHQKLLTSSLFQVDTIPVMKINETSSRLDIN